MLEVVIAGLFTITGFAVFLAIIDASIKARNTLAQLMEERALLNAGFVREIDPGEVRLRPAHRSMRGRRSAQLPMPRHSFAAA